MTRLAALLLLCAGCAGDIAPLQDRPSRMPEEPAPVCPEGTVCVGAAGLGRLTRVHYRRTVHQAFGAHIRIEDTRLPEDQRAGPFTTASNLPVTLPEVEAFGRLAETIAEQVVASRGRSLPCETEDEACLLRSMRTAGRLLYRRTLIPEEDDAYRILATEVFRTDGFNEAVRAFVETMLQSPSFLFRLESADELETRLDSVAVAARLSYFLFREGPDAALLDLAESGGLDSAADIEAEARRMLADPRADRTLRHFHREWLSLDTLEDIDRRDLGLSQEAAAAMVREGEHFGLEVVRADGDLRELLTARWSMLNAALASHYGVPTPLGPELERHSMADASGVLSLGGVLTVHGNETYSAPIFRGLLVRQRLLCQELGPAPAGALEAAAAADDALGGSHLTERQRLDEITMQDGCASCHRLMNPVGFAFGAFDHLGRRREHDASGTVPDTGGSLEDRGDAAGHFAGLQDLGELLAGSDDVAHCVTRQWFRYALQRLDAPEDHRSVDAAFDAFARSGYRLSELIIALTTTDAFLHRRAPR